MKIAFKELRKTPFEVKASIKNLKKTYKIQLKLAKLREVFNEESLDTVDDGVEKTEEELLKEEIAENERNLIKAQTAIAICLFSFRIKNEVNLIGQSHQVLVFYLLQCF